MKKDIIKRTILERSNIFSYNGVTAQKERIRRIVLSKDMNYDLEALESIGFKIANIKGRETLYNVTLPEGWSIRKTDNPSLKELYDENNNYRGEIGEHINTGYLRLRTRYGIYTSNVNDDESLIEVYFGNENEKLFIAGQSRWLEETNSKESYNEYYKREQQRVLAEAYADQNYPEWRNPLAYFEQNKKLTYTKKN